MTTPVNDDPPDLDIPNEVACKAVTVGPTASSNLGAVRIPSLVQPTTTPADTPEQTLLPSTSQGIGPTPAWEKPFLKLGDARPKDLLDKFSAALASRIRNRPGDWPSRHIGEPDLHTADPETEDT